MNAYVSDDYSVEIKNVSKKFHVVNGKSRTLKEKFLFMDSSTKKEYQVLNDISLNIKKGEAVGLIGENGAGKSTILKLLSKIIYPDAGKIVMRGRVACLIELGAGFHPDMTGRENIYINAAIFGLSKNEIDKRLNTIIEFSELEKFIDNPVRTYSSGMYMRLAFSIAINVEADILLIDEILAVGDAAFQSKCFDKLHEIKAQGTTIVIVSHSLNQIEAICDKSIWIKEGHIERIGKPLEVNAYYMDYMVRKQVRKNDELFVEDSVVFDEHLQVIKDGLDFYVGKPLKICLEFKLTKQVNELNIRFVVYRSDGIFCCGVSLPENMKQKFKVSGERKTISLTIEELQLLPGEYLIDIYYYGSKGQLLKCTRKAGGFIVVSEEARNDDGIVAMSYSWE